MKKIYLLILLAFNALGFGQATDLLISEYGEGTSGNSKYIEIFNGTGAPVDLVDYRIWTIANGGSWPEGTISLTGTLNNNSSFIIANNATDVPGANLYSGNVNWTGDDAVGLAKNISTVWTLIDVIGTDGADPGNGWAVAGTTDATANRKLTRKANICSPTTIWATSAGTNTTDSQWEIGTYSTGSASAGHTNTCVTTPSIQITAPTTGIVFSPETTNVNVTLSVSNFNVANGTGNGHIVYEINGGGQNDKFDTTAITVPTTPGAYSVYVELVDNSGNPLVPAQNATVNFTVASYTDVADLATLRAQTINGYYSILSAPVTTHVRPVVAAGMATRNQKYAEDATAGILIDDASGVLNGLNIAESEALTGLKGQLTSFSSVLQFVPLTATGVANTPATPVVPTAVSIADIVANPAGYKESQLVDLGNVAFSATTGTLFAINTNYTIAQGLDTTVLRTIFNQASEVDYIGTNTPGSANVIALITRNGGTKQVAVRRLADMTNLSVGENNIAGLNVYPNPAKTNLFITSDSFAAKNVEFYNVLGAKVLSKQVNNAQVNVSGLKTGVYTVKITEEGKIATLKLVIE